MAKRDKSVVGEFVTSVLEHPPERALEALSERRVVKLRCRKNESFVELYAFCGKERSYMMIPRTFCGCKDFELNVVLRGLRGSCYHLVALELAASRGRLRIVEVDCDTLGAVALELLLGEDSPTLRRVVRTPPPANSGGNLPDRSGDEGRGVSE